MPEKKMEEKKSGELLLNTEIRSELHPHCSRIEIQIELNHAEAEIAFDSDSF